jgi:predicted nucleotidyltransferase
VAFGSLIRKGSFTQWSDVDIAAWGIEPVDTFRAILTIYESHPDIDVNLVDITMCRASLLAVIEREGVDL